MRICCVWRRAAICRFNKASLPIFRTGETRNGEFVRWNRIFGVTEYDSPVRDAMKFLDSMGCCAIYTVVAMF